MQLADLSVGGFTLPQQTVNTSQNEDTPSVDIVEKDFALADATPLPDAQTLVLTENNNTVSSAIDQALHTDIDNNIAALSIQPTDTYLTVADHAKVATEEIAEQLSNITPILPDDPFLNLDNTMKVNPAVAMDMGKTDENETFASVSLDNARKSGFGKVTKETSPQRTAKETLSNILRVDHVSVTMHDTPQAVALDTPNETEPKTKYVFNQETKDIPFEGNVGKNMLRSKDNTPPLSIAPQKYVFNATNDVELSFYGETGKNLAKGKADDTDTPVILRQYVFAANDQETAFSGDVGKRLLLGVK